MADAQPLKTQHATPPVARNVIPFGAGRRVFYVEAEMLIPHKFLVAVSAESGAAACRLASSVITRGKAYGIPDFANASVLAVSSLRSSGPGEAESADRIEPIPAEHRGVACNASVTRTVTQPVTGAEHETPE